MKNNLIACLSLIFVLFNACSDAVDSIAFDKENMLNGYADLITAAIESFESETEVLLVSMSDFNEQGTIEALNNVQSQLLITIQAFQALKPYDIGLIESGLYFSRIGQWPILNNEIESILDDSSTIDSNLLNTLGANKKGLFGVEYILFNNQKSNDEILQMFTADINYERRKEYLKELTIEVNRLAETVFSTWNTSYKSIFISKTVNDATGSENKIYNESAAFIDEVLKVIRTPKDEYQNESTLANQDNLIGWHSGSTIDIVKVSFESLYQVYTNNQNDGLLDHLDFVNAEWEDNIKVSASISDLYDKIQTELTSIDDLEMAINSSNPTLDVLIEDMQELLVLYRSDMASWLSLILLVSDTDGD